MMAINKRDVTRLPHHVASESCTTRAKYRQGKKLTAVKVEDNCILKQCVIFSECFPLT
jgi:lipocalin